MKITKILAALILGLGIQATDLSAVTLRATDNVQSQFTKKGTYRIKTTIDLQGQTITIPKGSRLVFSGGQIVNSQVILDETQLDGQVRLYSKVDGSVKNSSINVDWFIQDNDLDPLYKNGVFYLEGYQSIVFSPKTYVSSVRKRTEGLSLKNIEIVGNNATIKAKASGTTLESIFSLNKSEGIYLHDLNFQGTAIDSEEEGGRHNLCLSNSKNLRVSNVRSDNAFTDALYIRGCDNVTIDGFIGTNSGRQACSITKGTNITITNSEFSGSYRVAPKSGLDIEPSSKNDEINNIVISGCRFNDNASNGLVIHLKACDTVEDCNIQVSDCSFNNNNVNIALRSSANSGKGTIRISGCSLNNSQAVSLQSKCYSTKNTPNVIFEDSTVSNANLSGGKDVRENASMISVHNSSSSPLKAGFGNIEIRNIRFHQDKDKLGKIGRVICLYNGSTGTMDNVTLDGVEVDEDLAGIEKVYMPKALKSNNGKSFKSSDASKGKFQLKGGVVTAK